MYSCKDTCKNKPVSTSLQRLFPNIPGYQSVACCEKEFYDRIYEVLKLLQSNKEWEDRYAGYAKDININFVNNSSAAQMLTQVRNWGGLRLYITVTEAKSLQMPSLQLRYQGQKVADIYFKVGQAFLTTKRFDEKNNKYFDCSVQVHNKEWNSDEASAFRKHFALNTLRLEDSRQNDEARIQSEILDKISSPNDKILRNIRPVSWLKNTDKIRICMPTPIGASDHKANKNSGHYGGAIDVLARIGGGSHPRLSVIEVKDENKKSEPPFLAVKQALSYAVFVRELLRSKSGDTWWKLLGYTSKLPVKLKINAVCAMPYCEMMNDYSFAGKELKIDQDSIYLHYIYFADKGKGLEVICSSL